MEFNREIVNTLNKRIYDKPIFIQIVTGPRQVGKTTSVLKLQRITDMPSVYSSADTEGIAQPEWIRTKWAQARSLLKTHDSSLLILDEVQLVHDWQATVKVLWDYDRQHNLNVHVIITGSSALLLKKGSESLAGRFETHELWQWSFKEMYQAFGYTLEEYILFGGYPGSAKIKNDEQRWKNYIRESIIQAVLTKDVIALSRINKPSLMQNLFKLACSHPAQIVSYNKFLGQLVDVGNVTTLSDYTLILKYAYLLKTLDKFSFSTASTKNSIPKWIIMDNSLVTSLLSLPISQIKNTPLYGRLLENAVIAHLIKIFATGYYWREKNYEVDLVVNINNKITAIEIKSGLQTRSKNGLAEFTKKYPNSETIIIGANGLEIEQILSTDKWIYN